MTAIESQLTPQPSLALFVLRVATGVVFLAHGIQKLFFVGIPATTAAFGEMGIPLAGLVAPIVVLAQFFGGLALVLGVFTRAAAAVLVVVMIGAASVHLPAGFYALDGGYEYAAVLAVTSAVIAIGGPGRYALSDRVLPSRVGRVVG